ncbi:hypothetical protein ACH5RR_015533 [Cinchona calisaya]|uniref:Uncharacterized protein n=1 Tax=Cinchona calisaya TaxID=153742 RepID=A0ABD2ZTG0_9GENT
MNYAKLKFIHDFYMIVYFGAMAPLGSTATCTKVRSVEVASKQCICAHDLSTAPGDLIINDFVAKATPTFVSTDCSTNVDVVAPCLTGVHLTTVAIHYILMPRLISVYA